MIYRISRTSSYGKKPCKEAVKRTFEYWHTRTCTEKEFNEKFSSREGLWKSKGKNHTVTKEGYITRQEENRKEWSIEIKTLKDLQKLIDKYGSLVIGEHDFGIKSPTIEIYDDYRE